MVNIEKSFVHFVDDEKRRFSKRRSKKHLNVVLFQLKESPKAFLEKFLKVSLKKLFEEALGNSWSNYL